MACQSKNDLKPFKSYSLWKVIYDELLPFQFARAISKERGQILPLLLLWVCRWLTFSTFAFLPFTHTTCVTHAPFTHTTCIRHARTSTETVIRPRPPAGLS